ncbi:Fibronectin type III domain-containing protein, partial [Flavobacterium fontis]
MDNYNSKVRENAFSGCSSSSSGYPKNNGVKRNYRTTWFVSLMMLVISTVSLIAQVGPPTSGAGITNGYSFAQTSGTYTPLSASRVIWQSNATLGTDAVSSAVTLPWTFRFNGKSYNSIRISNNGFITFGDNPPLATTYTGLSSNPNPNYEGAIAGFAVNLRNATTTTSEISYETVGGNTFVVQFQDLQGNTAAAAQRITFQIQLEQTTNVVRIVYGTWASGTAALTGQVGLKGGESSDVNNRTGTNWTTTTAGTLTTSSCTLGTTGGTTIPASGLTFTYTPGTWVSATGTYASLPFTENFGTWANGNSTGDLPNATNWRSWPSRGDTSWRANNAGVSGFTSTSGWTSTTESTATAITAPAVVPTARFHSYDASAGSFGYMDLFVDMSTGGPGTRTIAFDYRNQSGTDALQVQISTDGGLTFTNLGAALGIATSWTNVTRVTASTSATTVIRFLGTGDFGSDDIFIDNLNVSATPSCINPTALTASSVTANGATISWTAPASGNTPVGYEYAVTTSPVPPTSGAFVAATTASVTGLSAVTTYYIHVRSVCTIGTDISTWSTSAPFVTPCNPITTLPWNEGFESTTLGTTVAGSSTNLPSCWTSQSTQWSSTNATTYNTARTGSNYIRYAWSTTNAFMWTPPFQLTAGVSYDFSFFGQGDGFTGWNNDIFVNTTPSATGATQLTPTYTAAGSGTIAIQSYAKVTRSFVPPTTGVYYFAIRGNQSSGTPWYMAFDDFRLELTPTCTEPTALTANGITNTSANLNWTAATITPGNGYDYFVSTTNTAPTALTTPTGNVTGTTVALTGLNSNTQYFYWVRANCSVSDQSAWAAGGSFTTQLVVPTPYNEPFATTTTPTGYNLTSFFIGTPAGGNPGNSIYINLWSSTTSGNFSTVNLGPVLAGQVLTFDYRNINFGAGATTSTGTGTILVQISTNYGTSYTTLETINIDSNINWRPKTYNLSAYVGQNVKIRFQGTWATGDYYFAVDNIKIDTPCSGAPLVPNVTPVVQRVCPNLPVLPFTANGVDTGIGVTYQWEQSTDGGASWGNAVGGSGATTAVYTPPVFAGTTIQYRLRSTCTNTSQDSFSNTVEINNNANPLPLNEPFTNLNTLGGWTVTGGFAIGTARGATGNPGANAFTNLSTSNTTATLSTAKFGPVQTGMAVSFDLKISNFASPFAPPAAGWGSIEVLASTDCGTSYVAIGTISDAPTASYRNYKFNLGAYAGQNVNIRLTCSWLTGSYDVSIDNLRIDFTAPVIDSFTPTAVCFNEGGTVNLTGYSFTGTTAVTLNGAPVTSFTVNSDTSMSVVVPSGATSGVFAATNAYGTGSSVNSLTITPNPTVDPIVGSTNAICLSSPSLALTNNTAQGVWGTSNPAVATVNGGNVTALAAGAATITYTVTVSGCSTTASYPINVYAPVAITTQPSGVAILTGTNTSFSVVATGSGLAYQWYESTDGGFNFTAVVDGGEYSGATTATLTLTAVPSSFNNNRYYCQVTGTAPCTSLDSNTVILNVGNTAITTQPTNVTLCESGVATFSVVATGTGLTYQWYQNDGIEELPLEDGGDISGATSDTLVIQNADNTRNNYTYYVVVNGGNIVSSNTVTLFINTGVSVSTQPTDVTVCRTTGNAVFTAVAAGSVSSVQWQVSANGTTGWTNVSGGTYDSITGTTTLTIPVTGSSTVGTTFYRVLVNVAAPCTGVTSSVASLTIQQPTITVTPGSATYCVPGSAVSLTANGAVSYVWSPATGLSATTGATVLASPSTTTVYTVVGTDALGCTNSTTVTVTVSNTVTASANASELGVCPSTAVNLTANGVSSFTPANIGSYVFANTTSPYATIVGQPGTSAVTLSSMDDSISATQTIPFTFNFGGTDFTSYKINSNGWINLGGASVSTTNYSALNGSDNNVIAVFNRDLNGNNTTATSYYTQVTGTAPNRILKIEWVNVRSFSSTVNPATANFQLWLYEGSNIVEMRYGAFTTSSGRTAGGTVQVGLRGASNASVNVRSLNNIGAWSSPTVGTAAISTCAVGTFAAPLLPDNGRLYRFTPSNLPTYTYAWTSNPPGFTSSLQNPTVNPTVSTTYNVTVTSGTGCSATASVTVNIVADAIITTQPVAPAPLCQGGNFSMSVAATGPGLTYQWRLNGNNISGATAATYSVTGALPAQSGTYDVVVTPACGNVAISDPVTVIVNPTPTVTAPATQTYCVNATTLPIVLSGTPSGVTFEVSGGASIGLANQSDVTEIPSFTTTASGVATITILPKANGCIGTPVNFTIVVNALPSAPVMGGSTSPICENSPVNLTATSSALGYAMNPNSGVAFVDISTTGTAVTSIADDSEHNVTIPSFTYFGTTYTTARIGNNGVLVLGSTAGDIYWVNSPLPQGGSTSASTGLGNAGAAALCPWWDDLTPGTGASIRTQTVGNTFIVQWTNQDSFSATGTGTITFQIQLDTVTGQIHFVYNDVLFSGTDTVNDRGASATIGLNYNATAALQYSHNTASLNNGQSITFTPFALAYSWTGPNGFTSNQQNPTIASATTAASGTYTVTVTNTTTGCSIAGNRTISVLPNVTYYQDADNDGFGNIAVTSISCTGAPAGFVANSSDCNDANASIRPGAVDVCYDGIDNDCNGNIDNLGLPGGCTPIVST